MAQVKKLSTGGLIVNGEEYSSNDLRDLIRSVPIELQPALSGLLQSIENGKVRTYNPGNTVSGDNIDEDFSEFFNNNEKSLDKASRNRSKIGRNFDAAVGNKQDTLKRALSYIPLIKHTDKKSQTDNSQQLSELGRGSDWFEYGDDGKWIFGPKNAGKLKIIDSIFEEIGNKGKYSTAQNWASNQTDLSDLYAWANGKDLSSYKETLKSHLLNGEKLSDEEISLLRSMGFSQSANLPSIEDDEKTDRNKLLSKWKNRGYNNSDADFFSKYFILNDDGTVSINEDTASGLVGQGNHWWNDTWKDSNYYDYKLNPLYGHILYNGKLYRESELNNPESILYKEMHNPNQFYYLNSIGDYAAANQKINYLWDPNFENAGILSKDYYAKDLTDKKGRRFKVLNGLYEGLEDGQQLIQYFDMSPENMLENGSGAYKNKFALLDSNGNVLDEDFDITNLVRIAGGEAQPILASKVINRDKHSAYNGMIQSQGYEGSELSTYEDPSGKSDKIIISYPGSKRGNFVVSGELAEILRKHPEFLDEIASNSDLQAKFKRTIDSIGNRNFTSRSGYGLKPITNMIAGSILRKKDLQALGEDADRFLELIKEIALTGKGLDRRAKYFTSENPTKEQNGGTIDWLKIGGLVPKMQNGSTFVKGAGSSKNVKASSNERKIKKVGSYAEPGIAFDGKWTQEERWEIGGLIADLASLTLTVAGTGNPLSLAAAGTGAAGSLATFRNDVTRDGLQGKDVLGLAGNLALDASTLLPVVGSAVKGASVAGKIAKAAPTLLKLGAYYGLGSGFTNAVKKLASGEQWTWRDIRQVANALTGAAVLTKTGIGSGRVKGTPAESDFNFKLKSGDKTIDSSIKLSNDEIKQIKDIKDSSKQISKIKEIIISKKPGTKAEDIQLNTEKVKEQIKLLKPKTIFKREEIERATGIPDKSKSDKEFVFDSTKGKLGQQRQLTQAWIHGETPIRIKKRTVYSNRPNYTETYNADINDSGSVINRTIERLPRTFTQKQSFPAFMDKKHSVVTTGNILSGQGIPQQEPSPYFVPFESVKDDYYHNYYPEYKAGGKIIKAQNGTDLRTSLLLTRPKLDDSKAYNGSSWIFQKVADDIHNNNDLWHYSTVNNKPNLRRDSGSGETAWTPIKDTITGLANSSGSNGSTNKKRSIDTLYGNRPFVNIANLVDFGELLRTYSAADLDTWLQKRANRENLGGLQQNESEIYDRFSDYGERDLSYQNAARLENLPTATSDAKLATIDRLARSEKAVEMKNEADRLFSQKMEAFQNRQAEINRQYAAKRNAINNTNRALTAKVNVNDKTIEEVGQATKNAARQALSQQYRQEIRDKMNRLVELKARQDLSDTQSKIQDAFNIEAQNYYDNSVDHSKYSTFASWRDTDPSYVNWEDKTMKSIMNRLGYYGKAFDTIYNTSGWARLATGPRELGAFKNGGTLKFKTGGSTYQRKTTQEVMTEKGHEQSLKSVADASKQLRKSVLELLSKLIK